MAVKNSHMRTPATFASKTFGAIWGLGGQLEFHGAIVLGEFDGEWATGDGQQTGSAGGRGADDPMA